MNSLFSTIEEGNCEAYINLATSDHHVAKETIAFLDNLWETYIEFADRNFENEIKNDFYSRYWEMYLTCLLIEQGEPIQCPKPGPDISLNKSDTIWVEAVAPTPGEEENPDSVPPVIWGEVQDHPSEKIILRYRTAIREKFNHKYFKYRKKDIISEHEPYIIAISSCKIEIAGLHSIIPEIVKSVFPIGHQQIHFNKKCEVVKNDYQFKNFVAKDSGSTVETDLFFNDDFQYLSGILYSSATPVNNHNLSGKEIIFIHNPSAKNPVPQNYFNFGTEYIAIPIDDKYELKKLKHYI